MNDVTVIQGNSHSPRPLTVTFLNVLMVVVAVVMFLLIRWIGEEPMANVIEPAIAASPKHSQVLPQVLLAIVVIVITARLLGTLFQGMGQPRVIGEVVAGIVLGPSLLGRVFPETVQAIFPSQIMPILSVLAQLGVILYMFLVGLELNAELLRSKAHATVAISHASIAVPFILGGLLALAIFSRYSPTGVPFTSFALFLGVAMAITAFPVLARILTDLKIDQTSLGVVALSCAAVDDVTAWCLLAFVVGVAQANLMGALITTLMTAGYIAIMFVIVRPWLLRWLTAASGKHPPNSISAWVLVAMLGSSLITEAIGIHAIFGAFLLGAMIPHDCELARLFRQSLETIVSVLLLPVFFAFTGTRTQIGLLSHPSDWLICGVIIALATLGKFGGTLAAGRMTGLDWKTSASLGILMNTRGLMELIVLNIGLDLGIISPALFAMMVLMALVTTMATTPVLKQLLAIQDSSVFNQQSR